MKNFIPTGADYVIETYVDPEKTLMHKVMYQVNDDEYRKYIQSTVNPHCSCLILKKYFSKRNELIKTIKYNLEEAA